MTRVNKCDKCGAEGAYHYRDVRYITIPKNGKAIYVGMFKKGDMCFKCLKDGLFPRERNLSEDKTGSKFEELGTNKKPVV